MAESTVQEETCDNLYLIVKAFREATGEEPILVMDNIRIQANIPDDGFDSRYGRCDLPGGCRFRIPTHSPDFNQVAEITVGAIKSGARAQLYQECAVNGVLSPVGLQRIVEDQFTLFEKGLMCPQMVEHKVRRLATVLGVISTPQGQLYTDLQGHTHPGSGGDWPQSRYRT